MMGAKIPATAGAATAARQLERGRRRVQQVALTLGRGGLWAFLEPKDTAKHAEHVFVVLCL